MEINSICPPGGQDDLITALSAAYCNDNKHLDYKGLLNDPKVGNIALVSSFGAEAAILLHMTSKARPEADILFLDTGKHFKETLNYLETLQEFLQLKTLRIISPDSALVSDEDPTGKLHIKDPAMCCTIRKSFPLQDSLINYDGWITGRKRYQGGQRANLPFIEREGKHLKINPLIHFTPKTILEYFEQHNLPKHPLTEKGFSSIGCKPCTRPVEKGGDPRSGRWVGLDKVECGIHLSPDGGFVRNIN